MTGDPRLWVAIEVLLLVGCVLFYRWEAQHTAPDERVGLAEDADVEVVAQAAERLNVDPLSHGRLGPDQHPQLVFQRIRQRLRESRQEHPGARMGAREVDGAVQCNDRHARASGA